MVQQIEQTQFSSDGRHDGHHKDEGPKYIKVASTSRPLAVAGAIAGTVRDYGCAEVQAIGAGAVNQVIKSLAIAVGYLQEDNIAITFVPVFAELQVEGQTRTGMRFMVTANKNDAAQA